MMPIRMIVVGAALLAAAGMALTEPAQKSGLVLRIIDGDTYVIAHADALRGERVRARHFDTPEKGDRAQCRAEAELAEQASAAARRLLPKGSTVLLSDFGRDRYGRLLATITLPDGTDLAAQMIGAGLAHPYEGGRKPGWCRP